MTSVTTKPELSQPTTDGNSHLFDDRFDPIESGIPGRVRELIEQMIGGELDAVRPAAAMAGGHNMRAGGEVAAGVAGHRHGSRMRTLTGTFITAFKKLFAIRYEKTLCLNGSPNNKFRRPEIFGVPTAIHVAFRAGANPTGIRAVSFRHLISTTDTSFDCSFAT
jgi:hypothetical protein